MNILNILFMVGIIIIMVLAILFILSIWIIGIYYFAQLLIFIFLELGKYLKFKTICLLRLKRWKKLAV